MEKYGNSARKIVKLENSLRNCFRNSLGLGKKLRKKCRKYFLKKIVDFGKYYQFITINLPQRLPRVVTAGQLYFCESVEGREFVPHLLSCNYLKPDLFTMTGDNGKIWVGEDGRRHEKFPYFLRGSTLLMSISCLFT